MCILNIQNIILWNENKKLYIEESSIYYNIHPHITPYIYYFIITCKVKINYWFSIRNFDIILRHQSGWMVIEAKIPG